MYNHGFAEQVELYDEYHPFLANAGYEVILYDQRGAGKTAPGDLYALTNETHVFNDLDSLIEKVLEEYASQLPHLPLYLMGHSMGGGITLNYGIKGTYREKFDGYLAYAPLVEVAPETKPSRMLMYGLSWLAYLMPNYKQSPGLSPAFLTHNPDWHHRLTQERERKVLCSASQMHDMLTRGQKLLDKEYVAGFCEKPVAVFHSEIDAINDYHASKEFVELYKETHPQDKGLSRLYTYDDMYHCLVHETLDRQQQLLNDTLEWLSLVEAKNTGK